MPPTVKVCIAVGSEGLRPHCERSLRRLQEDAADNHCVLGLEMLHSCYLYSSRNMLVGESWVEKKALIQAGLWDYYWFVDSDIGGYTYHMLRSMIAEERGVCTVPYLQRHDTLHRYVAGMFYFDGPEVAPMLTKESVVRYRDIDWCGMGCTLFHQSIFTRTLPFPWFAPQIMCHTYNGEDLKEVIGEDLAICRSLHAAGVNIRSFFEYRNLLDHHK